MPSVDEYIIPRVLIAIAVIVVVARLMGRLFAHFRQPPVVGEIVGGILLGPTLLGRLPGNLDDELFPTAIRPHLMVVANLGLVTFMFLVGLELEFRLLRGKARTAATISVASIALPFALGGLVALWLYEHHRPTSGGRLAFILFIGASMSVTAFPVLARILHDRGMHRVPLGVLTLASAAVDDVLAWSLLAVVLAVVDASGLWDVPFVLLQSALFVAGMFLVVRPLLRRVLAASQRAAAVTTGALTVVIAGYLAASFVTAEIGIHQIFGAFVFGAAIPRVGNEALFDQIRERLEKLTVVLLLPVFFVATGLRVDVTGLGVSGLVTVVVVVAVACAGKFVGATVGAWASGVPLRKAAAVGVLMNTRGLTELVILGIGFEKHVLDRSLYTALVVMAVFTTIITEPLLRRFYDDRMLAADIADAARGDGGASFRVLVPVGDTSPDRSTFELARTLASATPRGEVVLARVSPPEPVDAGAARRRLASAADSLDALHEARAELAAAGIDGRVVARASADPAGELLTLAGSDVDALVVQRGSIDQATLARLLRDAPCDVVVVEPGGGGGDGIGVVAGRHLDDQAAIELAARSCLGRDQPLGWHGTVLGLRRDVRAALGELGLDQPRTTNDQREDWLFAALPDDWREGTAHAALGAATPTSIALVRSKPVAERTGLLRLVADRRSAHLAVAATEEAAP